MANPPPLKILHVAETAKGGVGSYVEEIAPVHVQRYGADAVRVVLPEEHALHFKRLPPASMRTFPVGGANRLVTTFRAARLAMAQVRSWRPDVVHLHSTYAGFALRPMLALMRHRPRVVYCSHGWAFDREGPRWLNASIAFVERGLSRWADAVVCISEHDRRSGLRAGIPPERLVVVMNGIADASGAAAAGSTPAVQWPDGRLRVLFVGRLDRQKGIDVFRDAMRRLGDRAAAVVVGSAVVSEASSPSAPTIDTPSLQVLGWLPRDEIAGVYAQADVLVVPSRWEGFGLVALEAMRAGCAVVASRVGGLPEVVEDGVSGVLVAPGEAEELHARLAELDAPRLHAMGAAGRARFQRLFRIERVADELDVLYRRLLGRRTQGVPRAPATP